MTKTTDLSELLKDTMLTNFQNWRDWETNTVKLKLGASRRNIRETLEIAGLTEPDDYQHRESQVRFRDHDNMALALLSGLAEYGKKND